MDAPDPFKSPAMRRILDALQKLGTLSARDIARDAYVSEKSLTCGGYLKALKDARLIYIAGWRKNCNGFTTPLYRVGNKDDLPRPRFQDGDADSPGMAKIVAALKRHGAMSYKEAALASGLSANTIKNSHYMDILVAQKRIHVVGWRRNKAGPMVAVYEAGRGANAPRPEAYSSAEKGRRHRLKQKLLGGPAPLARQLAMMG